MYQFNFDQTKHSLLLKELFPEFQKIMKLYHIDNDYRDVLINARLVSEKLVALIFKVENLNSDYALKPDQTHNLNSNLNYLAQQNIYPAKIITLFNEIRLAGNTAVHNINHPITAPMAWHNICNLYNITAFLLNTYENKHENYFGQDFTQDPVIQNFGTRENHLHRSTVKPVTSYRHILLNPNKTQGKASKPRHVLIDREITGSEPINNHNSYSHYRHIQKKRPTPPQKKKSIFHHLKSFFK